MTDLTTQTVHSTATPPISAVVIANDVYPTLPTLLESLRELDEVVVYENNCIPGLLEDICQRFPNVAYHRGEFIGFGPTHNAAVRLAKHDWIFSIDTDESASEPLMHELRQLDLSNPRQAFMVLRNNFFTGRHIKWGGWGNDWLVRLYHRRTARFNDAEVHELVETSPEVEVKNLKGPIFHRAVTDIDSFLHKISDYSELRRQASKKSYHPFVIVLKAKWAFFRSYVLQLGFMSGWRGLVIAWSIANGVFYKYIKIHSDKRMRKTVSRLPASNRQQSER
ncbi:MAG: glycosyltransferase family 2 protein [Gammaproteobacteria bacterium]|nr:glycosyltransferase family 2 protein [Gammaproteobacteria bacterium]